MITQTIGALPSVAGKIDANFMSTADAFLTALPATPTEMNTFANQANTLATTVNADALTASTAASVAELSALFKGTWSSATTYSIGHSVAYNGLLYRALLSGANRNPETNPTYWFSISSSLLVEHTVSSNTTSVLISGLNSILHKSYRVEIEAIDATGTTESDIHIFFNEVITSASYYTQQSSSDGASTTASRLNSSKVGHTNSGKTSFTTLDALVVDGVIYYTGLSQENSTSAVKLISFAGTSNIGATSISSIRITSQTASGLKSGSKIRIYRGDV